MADAVGAAAIGKSFADVAARSYSWLPSLLNVVALAPARVIILAGSSWVDALTSAEPGVWARPTSAVVGASALNPSAAIPGVRSSLVPLWCMVKCCPP